MRYAKFRRYYKNAHSIHERERQTLTVNTTFSEGNVARRDSGIDIITAYARRRGVKLRINVPPQCFCLFFSVVLIGIKTFPRYRLFFVLDQVALIGIDIA